MKKMTGKKIAYCLCGLLCAIMLAGFREEPAKRQICIIELVSGNEMERAVEQESEPDTAAEEETEDTEQELMEPGTEESSETAFQGDDFCSRFQVISDEETDYAFYVNAIHAEEQIIGRMLQERNPAWTYDSLSLYDINLEAEAADELRFRCFFDDADVILYRLDEEGELLETQLEADEEGWYSFQTEAERWLVAELAQKGSDSESGAEGSEDETSEPEVNNTPAGEKQETGTEEGAAKQETRTEEDAAKKESGAEETGANQESKAEETAAKQETRTEETAASQETVTESSAAVPKTTEQATAEVMETPHQHSYMETGRKEATCAESGSIMYSCTICMATKSEWIPETGAHNWNLITSNKDNTYQCSMCGQQYREANPAYVPWREATAEEKAQCLAAINAERAKFGFAPLSLRADCGAQAWANRLAERNQSEHDPSSPFVYDEGVGYNSSPAEAGIGQCYTCLGFAGGAGDYYNTDPYIEIGMAYHELTGLYYYCIRHVVTR
ncbi:MAG: hypothetical protein IJ468_11620 [Lachnospiraceae bacterium]|nr:hypothetical protein [Lachnospiraceae bacterium]